MISVIEICTGSNHENSRSYLYRYRKDLNEFVNYIRVKTARISCTDVKGLAKLIDFLHSKGKLEVDVYPLVSGAIRRYLDGDRSLIQITATSEQGAPRNLSLSTVHGGSNVFPSAPVNTIDAENIKFGRIKEAITLVNQTCSNPEVPEEFKMAVVRTMRSYLTQATCSTDMETDQSDE